MASLSDPMLWRTATNPSQLHRDGDLRFMVLPTAARMDIIYRTQEELFRTTMRSAYQKMPFVCAINGLQYSLTWSGKQDALVGDDPVPAFETTQDGFLISQGKVLGGRSAPQMFYLSYDYMGGYTFGKGDPPFKSARGVGGLGPIIIDGLPYGVGNLCKRPAKCPPSGPIPSSADGYVQQRNNLTYADQQSRDPSTGKAILATNKTEGRILVIVQPHGTNGTTFDDIKASLMILGCDNAVFLDGSDSAMLWNKGHPEVSQAPNKDETNTVALAFYL
jgi:exopolysaccharide biosynthesis protein